MREREKMLKIIFLLVLSLLNIVNAADVLRHIDPENLELFQRQSSRILGGTRAGIHQIPYTVSIRASKDGSTTTSFCGGSVISSTWILTAAHCTKGYDTFEIGMGSSILNNPFLKMIVYSSIEHPQYQSSNLNNDIALIKVPIIASNAYVEAVLLPRMSQTSTTFQGSQVQLSGWGRTSDDAVGVSPTMDFLTLKIVPNANCTVTYGRKIVNENVICAKGLSDSKNACLGDSGGPLVIKEGKDIVQVGIVSFVSSRGCGRGDPSGYTRVSKYLPWISRVTGIKIRD